MNNLKSGDERFRFAFDRECYAIDDIVSKNRRQNLMAAYDYNNVKKLVFLQKSLEVF
jgi:hypothetical protein